MENIIAVTSTLQGRKIPPEDHQGLIGLFFAQFHRAIPIHIDWVLEGKQ